MVDDSTPERVAIKPFYDMIYGKIPQRGYPAQRIVLFIYFERERANVGLELSLSMTFPRRHQHGFW
uniref:Uncharacterized protein n=1 Tax=Panthera leo TaxID=9689 RepID=A0A8C8XZ38_PANLE